MIPTIETIIEELLKGDITKEKAITWLLQHAADAHADLRDQFAAGAMQGFLFNGDHLLIADLEGVDKVFENIPSSAYAMADAMMKARVK